VIMAASLLRCAARGKLSLRLPYGGFS
jgi:hypothetical protein